MANKWDLNGVSASTANVVTASSFVGDVTGNITGDVTGDVTGVVYSSPVVTYTATGLVSSGASLALLDSSGAATEMTMGNPTAIGQRMSIVCTGYSSTCDVDADFEGATATVTFTAVGQGIDLVATTATEWGIVGNNGATLS